MTLGPFTAAVDHLEALRRLTPLEWVVVGLSALAAIWVIWRSVVLTLHPGEDAPDHIKRTILRDDPPVLPGVAPEAGKPSRLESR